MFSLRTFAILVAAGVIGVFADATSAALARQAGGSGTSGQLSSNRAIRRQQLICDPDEPVRGRLSVAYDPSMVTLSDLDFGPGYEGEASVEVRSGDGEGATLVSFERFLRGDLGGETGYVQVLFFRTRAQAPPPPTDGGQPSLAAVVGPGQMAVPEGYNTVDIGGVKGVDTHALFFDYLPNVSERAVAEYMVFADPGNRPSGNPSDALIGVDDNGNEFRIAPGDISSTTVRGNLIPLPPAVFAGGATLFGLWAAMKRRKLIAR